MPDARGGSSQRLLTTHRAVADPNSTFISGVAVTSLARTLVDMAVGHSFQVVAEKDRESLVRPHAESFDRWGWNLALNALAFNRFLRENNVPRAR